MRETKGEGFIGFGVGKRFIFAVKSIKKKSVHQLGIELGFQPSNFINMMNI